MKEGVVIKNDKYEYVYIVKEQTLQQKQNGA